MTQRVSTVQMGKNVIAVSIGAVLGAEMRYLANELAQVTVGKDFNYLSTVLVNLVGCGVLAFVLTLNEGTSKLVPARVQLMVATGFCGALTTFSTYELEAVNFWMQRQFGMAIAYGLGSAIAGMGAVLLGNIAGQWVRNKLDRSIN
jgi:fluoride exporter